MPGTTAEFEQQRTIDVHGDVDIAPGVAIAKGARLKADPGSRLILMDGVCLGSDTIVHARWGDLLIEPGATIGQDSLVIGCGRVGAAACIGVGCTLLNPCVHPQQIIPSVSYWRDGQLCCSKDGSQNAFPDLEPLALSPGTPVTLNGAQSLNFSQQPGTASEAVNGTSGNTSGTGDISAANGHAKPQNSSSIYGRDQVEQLLNTLFPQRRSLSDPPGENKS